MATPPASLVIHVPGVPVQEGNISFGKGHSYHREGKRLDAWRDAVAIYAKAARQGDPWQGAIDLMLTFAYKQRTKRDYGQPKLTRPDLSKLVRAVEDALTGIVYVDDNQVVQLIANKRYVDVGEEPGLTLRAYLRGGS